MLVGSTIGPFEIDRELGSGAMGTVYRAQYRKDGERVVPVALKVVALGLLGNEGAMARFEREANILKQLRHPHIVRLIATGRYRQTPFIAMEYIDGEPLDRVLTRRGRFSWEEVVGFGKQLCEALQYAHERGIIHRDLKPANLMFMKDGTLKLTDFGIAKDTDVTALTGANSTIGTAAYMSPEQCKGDRNLTNKSDLYSLGIVFFEFLTGRKPFSGESTVDMFLKHVNEKPPRPSRLVADLPGKLESLVLQLMEKNADERPVDAAWVGRILAEVEDDAFTRKSAGLDAANARRADRKPGDGREIDDDDHDAARALKGKRKRKARKPAVESAPWYARTAAKATAVVLVLLGIATTLYFAFKPPGPDKLFLAAEGAPDDERKLEAADRYLQAHGQRTDERAEKVQKMARDIRVRKREEVLARRFARGTAKPDERDDPKAYDLAWQAMEAEKAGDLKRAATLWEALRGLYVEGEAMREPLSDEQRARGLWEWLAKRRTADIKSAGEAAKVADEIELYRLKEQFPAFDATDPKGLAVRAFRLERFRDRPKARATWDMLAAQLEKDFTRHDWYLMAAQRRGLLPPAKDEDAPAARVQLVTRALAEARQAAASAQGSSSPGVVLRDARNGCRDIVDLYDGDPVDGLKAPVAEAKALLESLAK